MSPTASVESVQQPQWHSVRHDSLVDEPAVLLSFVAPLPGFPAHRAFVLEDVDADGLLMALRSVDDPDLRFFVISPDPLFADYALTLDDEWTTALGLEEASDATVLLIVTFGADVASSTANLFAPIVLNVKTGAAAQVIQNDVSLPLRAPLALV